LKSALTASTPISKPEATRFAVRALQPILLAHRELELRRETITRNRAHELVVPWSVSILGGDAE